MLSPARVAEPEQAARAPRRRSGQRPDPARRIAIYDVRQDCRHPKLQAQLPTSTGHDSGFSPDGHLLRRRGAGCIRAVDVADPGATRDLVRRLLLARAEPQRRRQHALPDRPGQREHGHARRQPGPGRRPRTAGRQISRLTSNTVSVPADAVRCRSRAGASCWSSTSRIPLRPRHSGGQSGGARLINLSRPGRAARSRPTCGWSEPPATPAVGRPDAAPDADNAFGYRAHYRGRRARVDPGIVACSFLNSGLRVFDVRDPEEPHEVAYFVAPPQRGQVAPARRRPGVLPAGVRYEAARPSRTRTRARLLRFGSPRAPGPRTPRRPVPGPPIVDRAEDDRRVGSG